MSVIGRLDDQVNQILIEPLHEKRSPEERPLPDKFPRASPPPPSTPAHTTPDESAVEPHELPVWLL